MTHEALSATHCAAFTDTRGWSAKEFAQLLEQSGVILCGDAKSFVLGRVIADEAEVLTLATLPALQGQGLATTQLAAFVETVKQLGAARLFLEVAADNEAAQALYNKANFTIAGHRPNYYQRQDGMWVDAIVMEKAL